MAVVKGGKLTVASTSHDHKLKEIVRIRKNPDIDGGWGWVVVAGVFCFNMLVGGTVKSIGLFYLEFVHMFPGGPTQIGLIGLTFGLSAMIMCPVGGVASDFLQPRIITILGGLVFFITFSCTSLTTNLSMTIITFGFIPGFTLGLIDSSVLSSVTQYFIKKRAMASGIIWSGSSVGNLILPPLYSWFIYEYTIRGALLLMGALWLHTCAIGLILLPIKQYNETVPVPSIIHKVPNEEENYDEAKNSSKTDSQEVYQATLKHINCKLDDDDDDSKPSAHPSNAISKNSHSFELNSSTMGCNDNTGLMSSQNYNSSSPHYVSSYDESDSIVIAPKARSGSYSMLHSDAIVTAVTQPVDLAHSDLHERGEQENMLNHNNSNKTPITSDINSGVSRCDFSSDYLKFLADAAMWRVLFVTGCGFFGYYMPFQLFPLWAEELSISKQRVLIVLALIGLVELVFRVSLGVMIDKFKLPYTVVLTVCYTITGISGHILALTGGFWSMVAYAIVHGMLGGMAHIVVASMLGEVVPHKRTGSAMGLVLMNMHLAAWPITSLAGLLEGLTGSYRHTVTLCASVYLMGAVVGISPLLLSYLRRHLCLEKVT